MTIFLTKAERTSLKRVVGLMKIKPGGFLLSLLLGVLALGSAIGLSATSAWLIARASQLPPVLYLTVAATAVRMFGVFRAVFRYLQRLASHKVALSGMDSLRIGIYDKLATGPINKVAGLKRGDLLTRTGMDVDEVGDLVVKSILPSTVTGIVGLGTVIGFALVSWPAALVLGACLLISGVIVPLITMRSARIGETAEQEANRKLSIDAQTIIESSEELQVSGRIDGAFADLNADSSALNAARAQAARPAALAAALDRVAMGAAVLGVFLVATGPASLGGIPAVMFAVLILTPLAAFEGTAELGAAAAQLVRAAGAAVRIDDLLGPDIQAPKAHALPTTDTAIIEAKNLSVGWPGGRAVVKDLSLSMRPGERIAIVGPSGVGKTTLLYTLAGMLEPKGGTANLNGVSVWNADHDEVTALVNLTTEDAHVFATSVFENLRVAYAGLTEDQATKLLEDVGLGEWLSALPHGLNTHLGTGGRSISGGERRRLLLARALASPAPLLLLDEPGEHLDKETADRILRSLFSSGTDKRGILVVTHRLSELDQVDQVLVLEPTGDSGSLTARGTHGELMKASKYYGYAFDKET